MKDNECNSLLSTSSQNRFSKYSQCLVKYTYHPFPVIMGCVPRYADKIHWNFSCYTCFISRFFHTVTLPTIHRSHVPCLIVSSYVYNFAVSIWRTLSVYNYPYVYSDVHDVLMLHMVIYGYFIFSDTNIIQYRSTTTTNHHPTRSYTHTHLTSMAGCGATQGLCRGWFRTPWWTQVTCFFTCVCVSGYK